MNELEQAQRDDLVSALLNKQEENGRMHHEICKLRLAIHTHKAALTEVGEWSEADATLWESLGAHRPKAPD